jgi:DNA-binding response OmpR family regulator
MTRSSILLVEDEKDVRDVLTEMISLFGHQVKTLSDGNEAWKDISHIRYDLIITDLGLPGLDGAELVRKMRAKSIDTPALIITGVESNTAEYNLKGIANCGFIQKPFKIEDLKYVINKALTQTKQKLQKKENVKYIS